MLDEQSGNNLLLESYEICTCYFNFHILSSCTTQTEIDKDDVDADDEDRYKGMKTYKRNISSEIYVVSGAIAEISLQSCLHRYI